MGKDTAQIVLDRIIKVIKTELDLSQTNVSESADFILGQNEAFLKILKTISNE
tara:strand:+ start:456 stop:614 length:159 start_codon:yes stop_codon:yes gene_type:complete